MNHIIKRAKLFLIMSIVVCFTSACTVTFSTSTSEDDFLAQILQEYPELEEKQLSIDTVARVVDGDTFVLSSGERVRLIGVNTPEVHGKTEAYGAEASDFAKNKLEQQTVYLFKDVSETDRYQRLLRYVFIFDDSIMFNETLVHEGYAHAATYPPDVLYADLFVSLERAARENNKGMWK